MQSSDDDRLQYEVLAALDSDPRVDADRIFVDVAGTTVRLTGTVPNLHQKVAVEQAVRQVRGVSAVVEQINVELPRRDQRSDADLTRTIGDQLRGDVSIPSTVRVTVQHGNVILSGTVTSHCQREEAASIAGRIIGVRAVANAIVLERRLGAGVPSEPEAGVRNDMDIARAVADALYWDVAVPNTIRAAVDRGNVTLTGVADWHFERAEAANVTRRITGVRNVADRIELRRGEITVPNLRDLTVEKLAKTLRDAAIAHEEHRRREGLREDADWAHWYAEYLVDQLPEARWE